MLKLIKTKKIGVDIDDVLSETIASFIPYLKEYHNVNLEYKNFKHFDFQKLDKFKNKTLSVIEVHEMWNEFSSSKYGKQMNALKGSEEKIRELMEAGFEMTLITARWEGLRKNTEEWLNLRLPGIDFNGIYFTGIFGGHGLKKLDICKQNGIELIIEDSYENCLQLAENGIKSYLIDKPWNDYFEIKNPNIKRVNSWGEIKIKQNNY